MCKKLRSVGLDVGTTTTQMVLSELMVENRASGFAVPELEITNRRILYKSPIHVTPLLDEHRMDAQALRRIIEREYQNAGITRQSVDTGAVIITGETSRKENAGAVLEALAELAGDFVVATAGPDLESVLAAKGAGALARSRDTGRPVLHMDIGGGTSNLALIRDGKIAATGCLNVGGRLVKLDGGGTLTYVSPVLKGLTPLGPGDRPQRQELEALAALLTQALEMAAGLRPAGPLLEKLWTAEAGPVWEIPPAGAMLSFSGGVAECIRQALPWQEFGDLGPLLGQAIRRSALCREEYALSDQAIRATVIGAGCHSAQLSGSTVYYQNVPFPLKNLPVIRPTSLEGLGRELEKQETTAVIALSGQGSPTYRQTAEMAQVIAAQTQGPVYVCLEQDMAKALGQALALRLPRQAQILCLDRVRADQGSYLDIGAPVGSALPVVVKTLVLGG